MSDLIARIECELECKSWDEDTTKAFTDCKAEIERLSAVGEPVAWLHHVLDTSGMMPDMILTFNDNAEQYEIHRQPLYTAPPTVDALIADKNELYQIIREILEVTPTYHPDGTVLIPNTIIEKINKARAKL